MSLYALILAIYNKNSKNWSNSMIKSTKTLKEKCRESNVELVDVVCGINIPC